MEIPTELEINPLPEDLDGQWAVRHFLGKTVEDAELMFRLKLDYNGEDLMHMGPVAFRYYFPAVCRYIQSHLPDGSPQIFSAFLALVNFWLESDPDRLRPVAAQAAELFSEILSRSTGFEEFEELIRNVQTLPEYKTALSQEDRDLIALEANLQSRLMDAIAALTALNTR